MAQKFPYERAALILVECEYFDSKEVAERWSCTTNTICRYRRQLRHDEKLQKLYEDRRTFLVQGLIEDIAFVRYTRNTMASFAELSRKRLKESFEKQSGYSEKDLTVFCLLHLDKILRSCGLPPYISADPEFFLGEDCQTRCDILVQHRDHRFTVIEVKTCATDKAAPSYLLYTSLGQILYYYHRFANCFQVDKDKINLLIVSDFDPDFYMTDVLNESKKRIHYLNLRPLVESVSDYDREKL